MKKQYRSGDESPDTLHIMRQMDDILVKHLHKTHGNYWESRLNVCKTVLTITSAALIGTISFSGSLLGPGKESMICPGWLIAAWISLAASICASLVAMWHLYQINSLPILMDARSQLVAGLVRDPSDTQALEKAIEEKTIAPGKIISNSDKYSHHKRHNHPDDRQ